MQQVSKRGSLRALALLVAIMMSFGIMGVRAKVALAADAITKVEISNVDSPHIGKAATGYTASVTGYDAAGHAAFPATENVEWREASSATVPYTGNFQENTKYLAVIEVPASDITAGAEFSLGSLSITWNGEAVSYALGTTKTNLIVVREYHTAPYTVKFVDGTSTETKTVTVEDSILEFPENTKQFFKGWVSAQTGDTHYKKGVEPYYRVNDDITFYADYGETRTLTFHSNYPITYADEVKSTTVQYGSSYQLSRIFSCSGYSIIGWSTEDDDVAEYAYNGTISSVTENMDLYAVWTYNGGGGGGYYPIIESDVTLVFHANHSNSTGSMSDQFVSASSISNTRINKNQFRINNNNSNSNNNSSSSNNYGFRGWTVETSSYNSSSRLIPDEAYVYTALNEYINYYTGRYYGNNNRGRYYNNILYGFSEDETGLVAQDEDAISAQSEEELEAQSIFDEYLGLYGSSAYSSLSDYYNYYLNNLYYNGYNSYGYGYYDYVIDLYAQWNDNNTGNTYKITFNSNGGIGTMSEQSISSDTSSPLKTNTFTRTGYTFDGWNTNANGTGTSYTNGQDIRPTSDMTLYAQWKPVEETPVTPVTPTTPTTTTATTTPTATTGAVAATTAVPTYATTATTPAVLAATADPMSFASVVTAALAGIGVTFAGIRSKKHSKR